MKKLNILFLCLSLFFLSNCSGGSDEKENTNNNPSVNTCSNVNGLQVTQNGELLYFTIDSNLPGPYEITFGQTEYFNPQNGMGFVVNDKVFTKSINNIGSAILEANKSYTFAVRRYCSSSSKSDWGFEKNLTISGNYCKIPTGLRVDDYIYNKIEWNISNISNGTTPVKYQVQYGSQGFTLGNGTSVETTQPNYNAPFIAGNTYEIYVRSYCSGSLGWGAWVGPVSFTASNTTACVAPGYANYTIAYATSNYFSPSVTWDNDGVSTYEYSLSTSSALPTPTTTNTTTGLGAIVFTNRTRGVDYYFYVRKKCSGNTYGPYYGPMLVKYQ